MPRLEIRLSEVEAVRLDELRGGVPKGTWVKERLGLSDGKVSVPVATAAVVRAQVPRASPKKVERAVGRDLGEGTPLPKIAPRKQSWL